MALKGTECWRDAMAARPSTWKLIVKWAELVLGKRAGAVLSPFDHAIRGRLLHAGP